MSDDTRAVSEVLGYALVFSLVIATVGIVSVAGLGELQDTRNTEQLNNAERAFDLLYTNMADIARRNAPSRSTEIRLSDAQLDVTDGTNITIQTNGSAATDNTTTTFEVSPIVYSSSNSDSTIVYAAGAVFRTQGESNGIAVRRPPFVARNTSGGRYVLPLVQTRSRSPQGIGGGTVRVRAVRAGETLVVSDTTNRYSNVTLNITSPRANLWLQMLSEYPGFTECGTVGGATNEVSCRIEDPQRIHISLVQVDVELSD